MIYRIFRTKSQERNEISEVVFLCEIYCKICNWERSSKNSYFLWLNSEITYYLLLIFFDESNMKGLFKGTSLSLHSLLRPTNFKITNALLLVLVLVKMLRYSQMFIKIGYSEKLISQITYSNGKLCTWIKLFLRSNASDLSLVLKSAL